MMLPQNHPIMESQTYGDLGIPHDFGHRSQTLETTKKQRELRPYSSWNNPYT